MADDEWTKSQQERSRLRAECSNYKAEIQAHAERNVMAKQQIAALHLQVMALQARIRELCNAQARQTGASPTVRLA
jgi:phage host-nuclease inhibitor protein Gam